MTDSINKTDNLAEIISSLSTNEINNLYGKYSDVLELYVIRNREQLPYLAYAIDTAYNYIKENHGDLDKDWKTMTVLVITKLLIDGNINSVNDVTKLIDDFIKYHNQNYEKYVNDLIIFDDIDNYLRFTHKFTGKNINNK